MTSKEWIGVDLDGTLAEYHGWAGGKIGPPVPKMAARVKQWLAEGKNVRIFTARVSEDADLDEKEKQEENIKNWCFQHFGVRLPVTHKKDFSMIELWDDRAIQVIKNTGERADGKE